MIRQALAAIGMAGVLLSGLVGATQPITTHAHPAFQTAHAHKTYSNTSYHYTMQYPVTWVIRPSANLDIYLVAPDNNAFLDAITRPNAGGSNIMSVISRLQATSLAGVGTLLTPVHSGPTRIHGVTFILTSALVRQQNGQEVDVVLMGTYRNGYFYEFVGVVVVNTPRTTKEISNVSNSLGSIRFTRSH